jgi:hypothetical protein
MLKRKAEYILIIIVFAVNTSIGQKNTPSQSAILENLFGRLSKSIDDSVSIQINDSIRTIVDSYMESDSVFKHRFSNVRYMGQITSTDSLVKIITWNLLLRDEPCRYYCNIIRRTQKAIHPDIYKLTAEYNINRIGMDTTYSSENWYGALYYDLRPQIIGGKNCWMLLGIDYGNPEITRKIIEILTFDKDDRIVFGLKSFVSSDIVRFREVFEYSSAATMTMRFGGDDTIVFDHLVPFAPEMADNRQYYGPQYSNDAYVLENGLWKFKLNVDARNKEKVKF